MGLTFRGSLKQAAAGSVAVVQMKDAGNGLLDSDQGLARISGREVAPRYLLQAGDLVFRSVANVICDTLRDMDMAFRYGGEEFVAICPGSRLHEGLIAAERVRNAIATKLVALKDGPVQVTASMGTAEIHGDESGDLLLQRADDALYAAKDAGRNRVFAHDGTNCVASGSIPATAPSV